MLGAQKAAERWACAQQKKDWMAGYKVGYAKGYKIGYAEGRAEARKALIAQLRARANGNPELNRLLDEIESGEQKAP